MRIETAARVRKVDGEHRFTAEGRIRDGRRDKWLSAQGYRVVRLNTGELADAFDGCAAEILHALGLTGESASALRFSSQKGDKSRGPVA